MNNFYFKFSKRRGKSVQSYNVYQFHIVAITNYHKLTSLRIQIYSLTILEVKSLQSRCWQVFICFLAFSRSQENAVPAFFGFFLQSSKLASFLLSDRLPSCDYIRPTQILQDHLKILSLIASLLPSKVKEHGPRFWDYDVDIFEGVRNQPFTPEIISTLILVCT